MKNRQKGEESPTKDRELFHKALMNSPIKNKLRISTLVGVKMMVIEFLCREDLVITTLREFFEIFISSITKEQHFHTELLSSLY